MKDRTQKNKVFMKKIRFALFSEKLFFRVRSSTHNILSQIMSQSWANIGHRKKFLGSYAESSNYDLPLM